MSQTLQRLRTVLEDPVLVRSGRKMVPTPKAEALSGPLTHALRALEQVFDTQEVDPASIERLFTFCCPDAYATSLQPKLFDRVARTAPHVEVEVVPYERDTVWDVLRSGRAEIAITGPTETPSDMSSVPLIHEVMVGVVREGHPILDKPITAKRYVAWPHALFRITGRGSSTVDRALAEQGLRRRIVGRTPYFLSSAAIVAGSDLIMTVPASTANHFCNHWPLRRFETPVGPLRYRMDLSWPAWLEADAGHRWFRNQVLSCAEGLSSTPPEAG